MIEPALVWWFALGIQLLAIPGSLLPVLPGLALLPLGALLWLWAVGWNAAWPPLLLAGLLLLLGWAAEALGLLLGPARLQASRWAPIGAGLGVLAGLLGLLALIGVLRACSGKDHVARDNFGPRNAGQQGGFQFGGGQSIGASELVR